MCNLHAKNATQDSVIVYRYDVIVMFCVKVVDVL